MNYKPNFFILGAPKCGTTSLAAWLAEHPNIFLSPIKEPHYFNFEDGNRCFTNESSYLKLFEKVSNNHIAIGEASVWYLSSMSAIYRILDFNPKSKFIVMLRNPIDMAPSLHQQNIYGADEDVTDFEEAWFLQKTRSSGNNIPPTCCEPRFLQYGECCKLGEQLKKVYELVQGNQIKTVFLDDLINNPSAVYNSILRFLDVPIYSKENFGRKNSAKMYRFYSVKLFIRWASRVKHKLGITKSFGIDKLNTTKKNRSRINESLREELKNYFEEDINLLAQLTDRDLSNWMNS